MIEEIYKLLGKEVKFSYRETIGKNDRFGKPIDRKGILHNYWERKMNDDMEEIGEKLEVFSVDDEFFYKEETSFEIVNGNHIVLNCK